MKFLLLLTSNIFSLSIYPNPTSLSLAIVNDFVTAPPEYFSTQAKFELKANCFTDTENGGCTFQEMKIEAWNPC
jgi:hypothetical protein